MEYNYDKVSTVAARLKEAMDIKQMKAIELSEKSGISRPSISCYLSGKYEPKQNALYSFGKALDVSEMWLAGYDVPMERSVEQKENDALADLVDRLRRDKGFRDLIIKISSLSPKQIEGLLILLEGSHN